MKKIFLILILISFCNIVFAKNVIAEDSVAYDQQLIENGKKNLLFLIKLNEENAKNNNTQNNSYTFTLIPPTIFAKQYKSISTCADGTDVDILNNNLLAINLKLRGEGMPEIYVGIDVCMGNVARSTYVRTYLPNAKSTIQDNQEFDVIKGKYIASKTIADRYHAIFNNIKTDLSITANHTNYFIISFGIYSQVEPNKEKGTITNLEEFSDKAKIQLNDWMVTSYYPTLPSFPTNLNNKPAEKEIWLTELHNNIVRDFAATPESTDKTLVTLKLIAKAQNISDALLGLKTYQATPCKSSLEDLVTETAALRSAHFNTEVAQTTAEVNKSKYLSIPENVKGGSTYLKEILPHKLELFNNKHKDPNKTDVSDYDLRINFTEVAFAMLPGSGADQRSKFASQVFTSCIYAGNTKTIFITFPYVKVPKDCPANDLFSLLPAYADAFYVMPAAAYSADVPQNIKSYIDGVLTTFKSAEVKEVIENIFKNLPKKTLIYEARINIKGELLHGNGKIYHFEQNTTNKNLVELKIWRDMRHDAIKIAESEYKSGISSCSIANSGPDCRDDVKDECDNDYALCVNSSRLLRDNTITNVYNQQISEKLLPESNLNESKITSEVVVKYCIWLTTKRFYSSAILAPDASYFYGNKNLEVARDNLVYIDIIGVPLSLVDLDFITDGIGMVYAGSNGLHTEASIYAIALLVPGILNNGRLLGKYGTKANVVEIFNSLSIVAKSIDNVPLIIKKADILNWGGKIDFGNRLLRAVSNDALYTKYNSIRKNVRNSIEKGIISNPDAITKLNADPTLANRFQTYLDTPGNSTKTLAQFLASESLFTVKSIHIPAQNFLINEGGLVLAGNKLTKGAGGAIVAEIDELGNLIIKPGYYDNTFGNDVMDKIFDLPDGVDVARKANGTGQEIVGGFGYQTATGKCFGQNCFVAGTLIHTADGLRPIETIEIGDQVLSNNPYTKEETYKPVTNTFVRQASRMVKVYVNGDTITTTYSHPFRVGNEWVVAGKLKKGDQLQIPNQALASNAPHFARSGIEVDSIVFYEEPTTVYNFEVEDFHTYFVGSQGYLVHNWCAIDKIKALTGDAKKGFQTYMNAGIGALSAAQRKVIYTKFNSWPAADLDLFFKHFEKGSDDLKALLINADTKTLDSWLIVAKSDNLTASVSPSVESITNVRNILSSTVITPTVPAKTLGDWQSFLTTHKSLYGISTSKAEELINVYNSNIALKTLIDDNPALMKVWASPYAKGTASLLKKADYDNAVNAIVALGTTDPVNANKAIYYFTKAEGHGADIANNIILPAGRGNAKLILGKEGFEKNMNLLFAKANNDPDNIALLNKISADTGIPLIKLQEATYYTQLYIKPNSLGKNTVPDDFILLTETLLDRTVKKYAIAFDSKLSVNSPNTPNQDGSITLTIAYQDNNWENLVKITSVNTQDNLNGKGANILTSGESIELRYYFRIEGDSSPSGIPNITRMTR
jgi:hypothetical protein